MKKLFFLLCLFASCLFPTVAFAQSQSVSQSDALAIAKRQFVGKDVDYYILSNSQTNVWHIFVDAEPMKVWHRWMVKNFHMECTWFVIL